ncbi:MAG: putative sulfate exporter family transporter [Anaeromicrobium sp.]|jgi:uncharacterized integral membrane protein (TIGR00698 family)|uniref:YeiH family protein n=1 Tax=Anaeromicrobium sp. TaxID=1929132 RepID=UPI0025EACB44|nr:putative sulfate exporter family transporter [Anaeromicrobium sp.]MCT4595253.1 putative sulfate exporter family transporter [Anaeromicrobium sp.]
MKYIKEYMPGIIFILGISYLSMCINELLKNHINIEALTIAIIIGIIYNNTMGTQNIFKKGVTFSLKKLLKVGIVLLGFKLNIYALLKLGPKIVIMVLVYVTAALTLSIILGKLFKVDKKLATLIGVGTSICGASAVVAMAPCINADDDDSVISVSVVSLLGAIGVILYSAIGTSFIDISSVQYGVWSGISLHGVAHALAAAFALGDKSGEIGTIVKMTRVLMMVPISIVLSSIFNKEGIKNKKAKFPTYVLYFILASVINSFKIIPVDMTRILTKASSLLILMAMTGMGLSVDFKSILNKGIRSFVIGTILFIILSTLSLVIILNFI